MNAAGARSFAAALAGLLAGCGGGVSIGWGWEPDAPPTASLVASAAVAAPGQPLRLAAAASDDGVVVELRFLRIDPDGRTVALGTDLAAPWEWNTVMPAGWPPGSTIRFYVQAVDDRGQARDSAAVAVTVGG